mgnify:CR=1 FL=1
MGQGRFEKREAEQSPNSTEQKQQKQMSWQQNAVLYLHDLVYLLAVIMLVFILLFRIVIVDGTSMNQTLLHGDYLLLMSNTFYRNPQYGDIVVISKDSFDDGDPIVKRVIATEGQTVDIDFYAGIVYVDGIALDEPYVNTPTNTEGGMLFPLTVEDGCVFVMGDNRNNSTDSRDADVGLINTKNLRTCAGDFLSLLENWDAETEAKLFPRPAIKH